MRAWEARSWARSGATPQSRCGWNGWCPAGRRSVGVLGGACDGASPLGHGPFPSPHGHAILRKKLRDRPQALVGLRDKGTSTWPICLGKTPHLSITLHTIAQHSRVSSQSSANCRGWKPSAETEFLSLKGLGDHGRLVAWVAGGPDCLPLASDSVDDAHGAHGVRSVSLMHAGRAPLPVAFAI